MVLISKRRVSDTPVGWVLILTKYFNLIFIPTPEGSAFTARYERKLFNYYTGLVSLASQKKIYPTRFDF
jgi:hypothetical protein